MRAATVLMRGAAAVIGAATMAACSSNGSSVTPTSSSSTLPRQARGLEVVPSPTPWLLTTQDLPTGWASTPEPPSATNICNGPPMTEVAAKGGGESDKGRWEKDSTALAAATFAFPDEAAAHAFIQANRAQTHSCSNYKQPTDRAGDVTLTPGDLSFPTLGDETYAAHVKVEVASVDGDFDYVWVRKGPNVTAVAMGGTFVDIDELEQLTNLAVAKLPA